MPTDAPKPIEVKLASEAMSPLRNGDFAFAGLRCENYIELPVR